MNDEMKNKYKTSVFIEECKCLLQNLMYILYVQKKKKFKKGKMVWGYKIKQATVHVKPGEQIICLIITIQWNKITLLFTSVPST